MFAVLNNQFREFLRGLDARFAQASLQRFRTHQPAPTRSTRPVFAADLDRVREHLTGGQRPVVVHHWSLDDPSSLAAMETLASTLGERAKIVTVNWDRPGSTDSLDTTLSRVERVIAAHRLSTAVYTGTPEALYEVVGIAVSTLPLTQVLDVDGGLLRRLEEPLEPEDVAGILSLLG